MLTLENTVSSPIDAGDAGIIIKADGKVQLFNTYTPEQLAAPTEAQKLAMQRLYYLMVALQIPQVMNVLSQLATDPEIVGDGGIQTGRLN